MGKSIRSKHMKKMRSIKRSHLDDAEQEKIEVRTQKLETIIGEPLLTEEHKAIRAARPPKPAKPSAYVFHKSGKAPEVIQPLPNHTITPAGPVLKRRGRSRSVKELINNEYDPDTDTTQAKYVSAMKKKAESGGMEMDEIGEEVKQAVEEVKAENDDENNDNNTMEDEELALRYDSKTAAGLHPRKKSRTKANASTRANSKAAARARSRSRSDKTRMGHKKLHWHKL